MSLLNERNAGAEVKWDADPNGDYLLPGRRAIPHGAECVCQESTFSKVKYVLHNRARDNDGKLVPLPKHTSRWKDTTRRHGGRLHGGRARRWRWRGV